MRVLYVSESWLGSCGRSLREAMTHCASLEIDEINEEQFFPKHRGKVVRGIHRLLNTAYRQELYRHVLKRLGNFAPDIFMVYKGYPFGANFINSVRERGILAVNVYPDYSPHAYGPRHRAAVGAYDLVISTKPFHVAQWKSVYGYTNDCAFVPQGYDPRLHLAGPELVDEIYDVVLVATWRVEYGNLMKRLAVLLEGCNLKVAIAGDGWGARQHEFPKNWIFVGELHGRSYPAMLRRGKVCIAPVTREVVIAGVRQPGDEDTTRTYELAAAHCFFIHRRTSFVKTLYSEAEEVPMFESAEELAEKVLHFLDRPAERKRMALMAHRRAVPAYSLDNRVNEIVGILERRLATGKSERGPR
jgi:glycosyltransferase involved in cell wall biosynthesis